MTYIKKQTHTSPGNAPLQEGDTLEKLRTYTENNYTELKDLINGEGSEHLEGLNFSAGAGIHESKIVGNVLNHPHFAASNLGERTIGDQQLAWDQLGPGATGEVAGGVFLTRTFRPGMKIMWGITQPITARATAQLYYGYPKNIVLRIPFTSTDGLSCPFSPGAVVHVNVTPMIPPGTNDDTSSEYFDGMYRLVIGADPEGFDLWICTEKIEGRLYLFSYVAMGWEVV